MNQYKENYKKILEKVEKIAIKYNRNPNEIKVLAVSKTHNYNDIIEAINSDIKIFAENYAQEFRDKNADLIKYYEESKLKIPNFEWHFIGHLQKNKVKYVVPFVSTIHTIDNIELAKEIEKQCSKINKKINVLIQINTSEEQNKSGVRYENCIELAKEILMLKPLNLIGLMTIGTFSNDENLIRKEFNLLQKSLTEINKTLGINLTELSMGMSHDFEIAIQEGATMLRIGTAIFGEREYNQK